MGDVAESEVFAKLSELFGQYKKACFGAISKVPYGSVPAWVAFSDGRMEDALAQKRGIWKSLKDCYVLYALSTLLSIVAFWWLAIWVGGILLATAAFVAVIGFLSSPLITAAAILIVLALLAIGPGAYLLLRTALFHIIIRFFGGRGGYSDTLSVIVMSSAAHMIFMIPVYIAYALIVGFIISPLSYIITIYVIYLQYKGTKQAHSLASKEAAVATVAAYVIELLAWAAVYVALNIVMLALRILG